MGAALPPDAGIVRGAGGGVFKRCETLL